MNDILAEEAMQKLIDSGYSWEFFLGATKKYFFQKNNSWKTVNIKGEVKAPSRKEIKYIKEHAR